MTRLVSIKMSVYAVLLVCLMGVGVTCRAQALCADRDENLRCLRMKFEPLYQISPDRFWRILNRSRDVAVQCRSTRKTLDFLRLVEIRSENAEFNEYFSETIEGMCAQKPTCLARATAMLCSDAQKLLRDKLMSPDFLDLKKLDVARCVPK